MGSPFYDAWTVLKQGPNPLTSGRPVDYSGTQGAGASKISGRPNVSGPPSMERISAQQRVNLDLNSMQSPNTPHWNDPAFKYNSGDKWQNADNAPTAEQSQEWIEGAMRPTLGMENYQTHVGVQDAAAQSANQAVAPFLGEEMPQGGIPFITNDQNQFLTPQGQGPAINEIMPPVAVQQPFQ